MSTIATTIACAAAFMAQAADLVTYPFNDNLDPETQQGVTASGFLGNGGSDAVIGMGNSSGNYAYILITEASTDIGDSVSNKQFAQFSVTAPPDSGMQLAQIQFSAARGANSSPRGVALRWSYDNYKSNLGSVNITSTWPSKKNYSIKVNAFVGGTVTFRLYAFADAPSKAEASIRFDNLVVTGSPVLYPPTVTPKSTFIETTRSRFTIRGTAFASAGIQRVEVAKGKSSAVYSGANGTSRWNYKATDLRYGTTKYYVRAIDETGAVGKSVRVRIKRLHADP